jgi:hypothetical protein
MYGSFINLLSNKDNITIEELDKKSRNYFE